MSDMADSREETPPDRRWKAYVVATVLTSLALGLRLALSGWIGERPFLIIFIIPIL